MKKKAKNKLIITSAIIITIILLMIYFAPRAIYIYKTATTLKGVLDKDTETALDLCRAKEKESDQDFCIMRIVELKENEYDFGNGTICEEIKKQDYKENCYLSLIQCEKIEKEGTKAACYFLSTLQKKLNASD